MRLQAQTPLRMTHAIVDRGAGVGLALWAIHGLQEEIRELGVRIALRLDAGLREDEL